VRDGGDTVAMTMNKAFLAVALGLVVSCGGSPPPASTPEPAAAEAEPAIETFGPGLASHDGAVDAVEREAARVLAKKRTLVPSEPGVLLTEWKEFDASRWPGVQTRARVEITTDRVIVRIECRSARGCARTVPVELEFAALPQEIANLIVAGRMAENLLSVMRGYKTQVCACGDKRCVDNVEKQMMEWAMRNMDLFKNMKATQAQEEAAERIEDEMEACKTRFDPPALPPAPPSRHAPLVPDEPLRPAPRGGTGSKACDQYLSTFDTVIVGCKDKLGPAYSAMVQSRNAQLEAFAEWSKLDKKSRKATIEAAEAGCKAATDALRQSATSMGCKL